MSLTGECEECNSKRLQKKLSIGASNDPLELEADRVADHVLAAPAHSAVSGAAPRIQRFTGQGTGDTVKAPASVDRVLASSGRPLDPAIQHDMGMRFGHDFSRVRVHTGAAAEKSARDMNAHAYTIGHNLVFGQGNYAPATSEGRRLLAHELTHVVQQGNCTNRIDRKPSEIQPVTVKIKWQGTIFASLYYFIRPVCKTEEIAREIVSKLLLSDNFIYLLSNGKSVDKKDFESEENYIKANAINIYDGAFKLILEATGNKTKDEFFNMLEANKVLEQKTSQLIENMKSQGIEIPYKNTWLESFVDGLGKSALRTKLSEAWSNIENSATSWDKGPAFYSGIYIGYPAGVAEDLWENIKGIFLLAWKLLKANFELVTDPMGLYSGLKQVLLGLWEVINADPSALGMLAGNELAKSLDKEFVKANAFNQGFALGEIIGKISTEIALLFVGVEEVLALAKAAEGTKIGELILKGIKESEMLVKARELLKGEKGVKAAEDTSSALTDAQKLEEAVISAQKASGDSKPSKELIKLEQSILEEKIKNPENIKLSDKTHFPEVEVGEHTYKKNANDHWCRFTIEDCDINLDPALKASLDKAAAKKSALDSVSAQKRVVTTLYEHKAAAEAELAALRAKPDRTAEDISEIRKLEAEILKLDPQETPGKGIGKIAEAEKKLADKELEAAKAELTLV